MLSSVDGTAQTRPSMPVWSGVLLEKLGKRDEMNCSESSKQASWKQCELHVKKSIQVAMVES